ncbi:MAG: zinc ribbon domain-containing protein [Verrucomicrobiota bacterium]
MPTYIYETIPQSASEEPVQFEVKQSMIEDALTKHPETGQPVRRIIIGGVSSLPSRGRTGGGGKCCSVASCCG